LATGGIGHARNWPRAELATRGKSRDRAPETRAPLPERPATPRRPPRSPRHVGTGND
jgi:hypothetical protein